MWPLLRGRVGGSWLTLAHYPAPSAAHSPTRVRRLRSGSLVAGAAVGAAVAGAAVAGAVLTRRFQVEGRSMEPALAAGDRVVAVRGLPVRAGSVVLVRDPRDSRRLMVKRVVSKGPDGVVVAGDNPAASTDSRQFGPVRRRGVIGPVLYRYFPPEKAGRPHGER